MLLVRSVLSLPFLLPFPQNTSSCEFSISPLDLSQFQAFSINTCKGLSHDFRNRRQCIPHASPFVFLICRAPISLTAYRRSAYYLESEEEADDLFRRRHICGKLLGRIGHLSIYRIVQAYTLGAIGDLSLDKGAVVGITVTDTDNFFFFMQR